MKDVLNANITFYHRSINSFFSIDKVICQMEHSCRKYSFCFARRTPCHCIIYDIHSINRIFVFSERYYVGAMEKCRLLLSMGLQFPASIHLPEYLAKKHSELSKEKLSGHYHAPINQSFEHFATQVSGKIFKQKHEVDFRTTRYKVRPSTKLFPFNLLFSFREYFYLPLL